NPEVRVPSEEIPPPRRCGDEHTGMSPRNTQNLGDYGRHVRKMLDQLQTKDRVEHSAPKWQRRHIGYDSSHSQNPCNIVPLTLHASKQRVFASRDEAAARSA